MHRLRLVREADLPQEITVTRPADKPVLDIVTDGSGVATRVVIGFRQPPMAGLPRCPAVAGWCPADRDSWLTDTASRTTHLPDSAARVS